MTSTASKAIEISLTDFIDFVCKTGSAKMTKVKEVKHRAIYSPAFDFYKPLREGIITNHKSNGDKKDLQKIIAELKDPKKISKYCDAIGGYEKFWGKKKITWFTPPNKRWAIGDLRVRINPELGLIMNEQKYIVKLYLKEDKVQKSRIDQILTLMEKELRNIATKDALMAVLDVKSGKMFIKENDDISLLPLLEGEAISFETIWKGIK
jgi:hypothetical protein